MDPPSCFPLLFTGACLSAGRDAGPHPLVAPLHPHQVLPAQDAPRHRQARRGTSECSRRRGRGGRSRRSAAGRGASSRGRGSEPCWAAAPAAGSGRRPADPSCRTIATVPGAATVSDTAAARHDVAGAAIPSAADGRLDAELWISWHDDSLPTSGPRRIPPSGSLTSLPTYAIVPGTTTTRTSSPWAS